MKQLLPLLLGVSLVAAQDVEEPAPRLSDKGILGEKVLRDSRPFAFPRSRPQVVYFKNGPYPEKTGAVQRKTVEVRLLERAGVARPEAAVSFGFPIAEGALFDLGKLRVLDESQSEYDAEAVGLSLWPDGSIKSALISFSEAFPASGSRKITVEYGNEVSRKEPPKEAPIRVEETQEAITVATGKIEVVVGKEHFIPFQAVRLMNKERRTVATGSGIELRDENGLLYSTAFGAPERVTIERSGNRELVLRVEGKFANQQGGFLMRYITRLRFLAGSSRVDLIHTHIDDELANEFCDFSSLSLGLDLPRSEEWSAKVDIGGESKQASAFTLLQKNESEALYGADSVAQAVKTRPSGVVSLQAKSGVVQAGVANFWQRWPKGMEVTPGRLVISLLPKQTPEFSAGLPPYLSYPFVEGRYRLKWGMAFTERLSFDFCASDDSEALAFKAELNDPIVAVIDAPYLSSTGVLGPLSAPDSDATRHWDAHMRASLLQHHRQREKQREYGAFNYGDWYGERGRNWGNNEYDRAHGFFSHFARTGEAAFLVDAIAAARHQADSDIVHAYPDPFYIGANPQHSIGHTGVSYQNTKPTWSHQYERATIAGNGHTWTDGMADCWLLTGDPVVMESLLALGEHITWAFAPSFKQLIYKGAHERSAGWSLMAAMGAYRATSDPAYLDAAQKIATVALKEWEPRSGAWPHQLPAQHAGFREGVHGNSVYNIGILLLGLARYHAVTQDPMVLKCLDGACEWLQKSWNPAALTWPYSASKEGAAVAPDAPNLNPLIYPALAYTGAATGKESYLQIAFQAFSATFPPGSADDFAKELSIKAYASTETLGYLARGPVAQLITDWPTFGQLVAERGTTIDLSFSARTKPSFRITQTGKEASLVLRSTEGKSVADASIELISKGGTAIPFSNSDQQSALWKLSEKEGDSYILTVDNPYRWRIWGEGITVDYIGGHPLRLGGYRIIFAEWGAVPGQTATLHLEGGGVGALVTMADGTGHYAQQTPDADSGLVTLTYTAESPVTKIALWGSSAFTISFPADSPAFLRLLNNRNP